MVKEMVTATTKYALSYLGGISAPPTFTKPCYRSISFGTSSPPSETIRTKSSTATLRACGP